MSRRRKSLARQFLALQLLIVLLVLIAVAAISLAQSAQTIQRVEGRRALSAAESLAANPIVSERLPGAEPRVGAVLPAVAESVRTISGSANVILATPDRTILTSADPALIGERLYLGESRVLEGRAWSGLVSTDGKVSVAAHVPVLNADGELVGIAAVERKYPSVLQRLGQATPNLLAYLGIASVLGVAGSLLLSRRVKRQTLGMEPREITGLVEHREAMLHGLKEGVIALDPQHRVTLVNDSARDLLNLPVDCLGRKLDDIPVPTALLRALTEPQPAPDQLVLVGERLVTFNRRPIRSLGGVIGSVTTLRDRTELSTLEKELVATRTTTETLRAQTHEFNNQLHTISGLIQLGEYDEVVHFVDGVRHNRSQLYEDVTSRIKDPALAALFIAKISLAAEHGVVLELAPESRLDRIGEAMSRDLNVVLGNLVDNALDAVARSAAARVCVRLVEEGSEVLVIVRDSGPGVPAEQVEDIFRQGYTTKPVGEGGRGFGLALTRIVCQRRGGGIDVHNDSGAVFTARLPVRAGGSARPGSAENEPAAAGLGRSDDD